MTVAEILTATAQLEVVLAARGETLHVEAPAGRLTPELRAALTTRKAELVAVLWRLEAMRATAGQRPLAFARLETQGGPGRCFSCGDPLEHPRGYGRCAPCDVAAGLFYSEQPDDCEVVA